MATTQKTIQYGIKSYEGDMTQYALFLGGANVTHEVLASYDPLRTGYGRLFMVKKPVFLQDTIPDKLKNFKHLLEYGNTSVQGIADVSVSTESITAGYVGKSWSIPTVAQDGTDTLTIQVYDYSGSPVREVLHSWINGATDLLTGLTHYNGADPSIPRIQANQTAEFVYVSTDITGENVEYACLFANCFPTNINLDVFNYTAGQHNLVQNDISFTCVKYESIQINKVGKALLDKFKVLTNSLNFYSGYSLTGNGAADEAGESSQGAYLGYSQGVEYDVKTGKLRETANPNSTMIPQDFNW